MCRSKTPCVIRLGRAARSRVVRCRAVTCTDSCAGVHAAVSLELAPYGADVLLHEVALVSAHGLSNTRRSGGTHDHKVMRVHTLTDTPRWRTAHHDDARAALRT